MHHVPAESTRAGSSQRHGAAPDGHTAAACPPWKADRDSRQPNLAMLLQRRQATVRCSPLVPWQRLRIASVTGLGFSLAARSAAAAAEGLLSDPPPLPAAGAAASWVLPTVRYPCSACSQGVGNPLCRKNSSPLADSPPSKAVLSKQLPRGTAAMKTAHHILPLTHTQHGTPSAGGGSPALPLRRAPQKRHRCDVAA